MTRNGKKIRTMGLQRIGMIGVLSACVIGTIALAYMDNSGPSYEDHDGPREELPLVNPMAANIDTSIQVCNEAFAEATYGVPTFRSNTALAFYVITELASKAHATGGEIVVITTIEEAYAVIEMSYAIALEAFGEGVAANEALSAGRSAEVVRLMDDINKAKKLKDAHEKMKYAGALRQAAKAWLAHNLRFLNIAVGVDALMRELDRRNNGGIGELPDQASYDSDDSSNGWGWAWGGSSSESDDDDTSSESDPGEWPWEDPWWDDPDATSVGLTAESEGRYTLTNVVEDMLDGTSWLSDYEIALQMGTILNQESGFMSYTDAGEGYVTKVNIDGHAEVYAMVDGQVTHLFDVRANLDSYAGLESIYGMDFSYTPLFDWSDSGGDNPFDLDLPDDTPDDNGTSFPDDPGSWPGAGTDGDYGDSASIAIRFADRYGGGNWQYASTRMTTPF